MGRMDETYKWRLEITVDPMWVADGLDLTAARMHDILTTYFGHVRADEIRVKTLSAPERKQIRAEQGEHIPGYGARYQE